MRPFLSLAAALVLGAVFAVTVPGQGTTDPVGFIQPFNSSGNQINLLANADTLVSLPLTRLPAFTGAIQSIAGNVVTVSGAAPFTAHQFVYSSSSQHNHYYALLGAGTSANPKEGHTYPVTDNGTGSVTLDTSHDDLNGVPAGSQIQIIPNWTLGTVFPASDANVSYTPTTATRTFKTQILIPNYNAAGTNQAFSTVYFYSNNVNSSTNNVGWRIAGDNTTPHDDDVLLADGYFVVRNQNGAPGLTLTLVGGVLTKKLAIPLSTLTTGAQDNSVAMIRPVDVSLNNSGLNPTDGSFVATTQTRSFKDQLLLFNNAAAVLNKAPSAVYFYSNNVNGTTNNVGWRLAGDNLTDHGNDMIPAGSAMIIRKAATANGATVFWTNSPTY